MAAGAFDRKPRRLPLPQSETCIGQLVHGEFFPRAAENLLRLGRGRAIFVTIFYVLGLRYAFGIFYVAILDDTGWSRADTAGVFSVAMAVYAVSSLLSGTLFDTIGPRKLFPIGALILGAGLLLASRVESIFELYLYYGVVIGLAYAFLGFIPHMALVSRWFVKRRGLASAVALSGIGAGSLVMSIAAEELISQIGWRETFRLFAWIGMAALIPLTFLVHRNHPRDM